MTAVDISWPLLDDVDCMAVDVSRPLVDDYC